MENNVYYKIENEVKLDDRNQIRRLKRYAHSRSPACRRVSLQYNTFSTVGATKIGQDRFTDHTRSIQMKRQCLTKKNSVPYS